MSFRVDIKENGVEYEFVKLELNQTMADLVSDEYVRDGYKTVVKERSSVGYTIFDIYISKEKIK